MWPDAAPFSLFSNFQACLAPIQSFSMQNKIKVNDWTSIQTVFDKMQKQLEKAMKTANLMAAPRLYIKMLCELEDSLTETLANKEVKKKMSTTNAKALNTMKQRLRKLLPEYGEAMAKWREDPVDTEDEEESEEESEEEDDEGGDAEAEDESLKRWGFSLPSEA